LSNGEITLAVWNEVKMAIVNGEPLSTHDGEIMELLKLEMMSKHSREQINAYHGHVGKAHIIRDTRNMFMSIPVLWDINDNVLASMDNDVILIASVDNDGINLAPTLQTFAETTAALKFAPTGVVHYLHHQAINMETWKFRRKFSSDNAFLVENYLYIQKAVVVWPAHVQQAPWFHVEILGVSDLRFASFLADLLKLDLWATDTGNPHVKKEMYYPLIKLHQVTFPM
jgi:hypothetical protein